MSDFKKILGEKKSIKFESQVKILPRLLRLKDAPSYLGMNRNYFNKEIRPYLPEIRIGKQGIAFDRLDLDAWVGHYKQCSECSTVFNLKGEKSWGLKHRQVCSKGAKSGILKSKSSVTAFAKALAQSRSSKQSDI